MWSTGSKKGFTFIEIMVTLAILSAGLVSVYRSLFILLDSIGFVSSRLQAQCLVDNKVWEIENNLKPTLIGAELGKDASLGKLKDFRWQINISPIKGLPGLSNMRVAVLWQEKGRQAEVARDTYLEK